MGPWGHNTHVGVGVSPKGDRPSNMCVPCGAPQNDRSMTPSLRRTRLQGHENPALSGQGPGQTLGGSVNQGLHGEALAPLQREGPALHSNPAAPPRVPRPLLSPGAQGGTRPTGDTAELPPMPLSVAQRVCQQHRHPEDVPPGSVVQAQ